MLNKSRAKFNGVPKRQAFVNFQAANFAINDIELFFYFFNLYVLAGHILCALRNNKTEVCSTQRSVFN